MHELRTAGLPVSMTENLDAMRAIEHIAIDDREMFKAVLGATLVKHHRHQTAFDTVFDVYFSLFSRGVDGEGDGEPSADGEEGALQDGQAQGGGGGTPMSREELAAMLLDALMNMDRDAAAPARGGGGAAVRGHGAGPARRRHLLPVPHAAAARPRRPAAARSWTRRASGARSTRASSPTASRTRSSRPGCKRAAGAHRGGDPPPARRRPRRRGDGAHAAQAAARGHRLHARVARGDARAAAGRSTR